MDQIIVRGNGPLSGEIPIAGAKNACLTLMPATLSLLRTMFLDRTQRRLAIAIWATGFAAGAALGPVVGGVFAEHLHWSMIFWINLPLAAAALALLLPKMGKIPVFHRKRKVDWLGGVLLMASAVVLITRCVDAEEAFSFVDARLMAMIFAMLAVGEALEHTGTVKLIGTDEERIVEEVTTLLHNEAIYTSMANAVNPYGDGRAAERTVAAIAQLFGVGERMADFDPEAQPEG